MRQISNLELARLVAANYQPSQIAQMLQVTTSAITQACASEDVKALVADLQDRTENQVFDDRYDGIEARAAQLLEQKLMSEGQSLKIRDLTHTVQLLNGLKRRTGLHSGNGTGGVPQVVQLNLPVHITQQIVISPQAEIVEINGRQMQTVQPTGLKELLNVHKQQQALLPAELLD